MKKQSFLIIIVFGGILTGIGSLCHAGVQSDEGPVTNNFLSMTWDCSYDESGRIKTLVAPGNKKTEFAYDRSSTGDFIEKITRKQSSGKKAVYEFDCLGRCTKMSDATGTASYEYNKQGRLEGVSRDGCRGISYTYDTMDRLSSMSIGNDMTVRYNYDFLGRLSKIKTPAGDISYEYWTSKGINVRNLPNGMKTQWEYNPDGSLKSIIHVKGNNVVSQFEYSYRPDGLIRKIDKWSPRGEREVQYRYDKVHRLISVTDPMGTRINYQYDKFGNRLEKLKNGVKQDTGSYDWTGRMKSHNGRPCSHDEAGNLTADTNLNDGRIFEFNDMNLLKSVTKGKNTVLYRYDADGYLISRTAGGRKTSFLPDPLTNIWRPLLKTDTDGKRTFYIWDGVTPLMALTDKGTIFFLHDHLGSVRCIADKNGNIISRYDYSPFGVPQQDMNDDNFQPGFAGLFYDPDASAYLTRGRVYHPETGRFLQIDPQHRIPFGMQKDLSLYTYCGGDPVNYVDSTGLDRELSPFANWAPVSIAEQDRDVIYPDLPSLDKLSDPQIITKWALGQIKDKAIESIRDSSDHADLSFFVWDEANYAKDTFEKFTQGSDPENRFDVALRLVKQFGRFTLPGATAGQILQAKKLYTDLYENSRSVINQRMSESMVRLPLNVIRSYGQSVIAKQIKKQHVKISSLQKIR